MRMDWLKRMLATSLLFLLLATPAAAEVDVAAVTDDLRSAEGYLVMPMADQFLVDLDAASGVRAGDLLSVVEPGRKILHPVTGEAIGSLDQVKAVLKVTQVKTGYSYAVPIGTVPALKAGEKVRRFDQIRAVFWDYAGGGESLYQDLSAGLAHFDWQSYAEAQAARPSELTALAGGGPAILFIHDEKGLSIRGNDLTPLRSYSAKAATMATPVASGGALRPMPNTLTTGNAPVASQATNSTLQMAQGGIVRISQQAREGIWQGPTVPAAVVGVEVAEFDGDGRVELAMAYEDYVEISRLADGAYTPVARIDLPRAHRALHLDGADLNGDGRHELYVTAVIGAAVKSLVIEHGSGGFKVTQSGIPWYFCTKELPGEGRVLLAQNSDFREQNDFVGEAFRVERHGDKLVEGQVQPIPKPFTLYDYHAFVGNDGVRRVAGLSEGDALIVAMPEGSRLWKGSETLGGSLAAIERYVNVNAKTTEGSRTQYLRARIAGGPGGEVLVPVNEGMRMLTRLRSYGSSHLRAMTWNGGMLQEVWRTLPQSGYLADFRVADIDNDGADELVMAIAYSLSGFMTDARSGVVVYDMQ